MRRQIAVWQNNRDEDHAFDDWLPDGVLMAPRGVRVVAGDILGVINGWHVLFTDLEIELTALFASANNKWLALEWIWHVTRRADGARSSTLDSIIVELRDNKIAQWREYFDTYGSVEFGDPP